MSPHLPSMWVAAAGCWIVFSVFEHRLPEHAFGYWTVTQAERDPTTPENCLALLKAMRTGHKSLSAHENDLLLRMADTFEGMLVRLGSIGAAPLPPPPAIKTFSNTGRTLADRFLARAVFFDGGDEERLKAANRMARAIRPAQKGKDSFGDCLITECSLSLTRRLKAAKHAQPILFVSSNVADYCITRSKLAPPLDDEFQEVDLAFACRWAAACWLARRDGGKIAGTAAHGFGGAA